MEDKCAKIYACRHYICILFSGTADNRIAKNKDTIFRILFYGDYEEKSVNNNLL